MTASRFAVCLWTALLAALAALPGPASAQTGIPFNQRDDQYVLLGLKRAREIYDVARADLERTRELKAKGLATDSAVDQARRAYADAEVNYQQSILAVLFEKQYVAVVAAVKAQAADGSTRVRLTLENTSGGSEEFHKLVGMDDALYRALQPDTIQNVYVSLLNSENAIISQPYEAKVSNLRFREPVSLDFSLLQDLDAVTVNLLYGNGSTRAVKIYLQKDQSVDRVVVQSEQFSQEAELGGSASFDLSLELFSGQADSFRLEAVNLPPSLTRYFVDPSNQARLRQLRFSESNRTRDAALRVFLPDRASADVPMDSPIAFYVLAAPQERLAELGDIAGRTFDEDDIVKLGVGYVRLELVPRGVGRLLVRAPQLFHTTHAGEPLTVTVEVTNEGSRVLDNVEVSLDPPMGWGKTVTPALLPSLDVGAEQVVSLSLEPPPATAVGKYEVRIRTTSFADTKPIVAEDKTLTVQVAARTSIAAPAILVTLLLAVIGGVVVLGVRIARR